MLTTAIYLVWMDIVGCRKCLLENGRELCVTLQAAAATAVLVCVMRAAQRSPAAMCLSCILWYDKFAEIFLSIKIGRKLIYYNANVLCCMYKLFPYTFYTEQTLRGVSWSISEWAKLFGPQKPNQTDVVPLANHCQISFNKYKMYLLDRAGAL